MPPPRCCGSARSCRRQPDAASSERGCRGGWLLLLHSGRDAASASLAAAAGAGVAVPAGARPGACAANSRSGSSSGWWRCSPEAQSLARPRRHRADIGTLSLWRTGGWRRYSLLERLIVTVDGRSAEATLSAWAERIPCSRGRHPWVFAAHWERQRARPLLVACESTRPMLSRRPRQRWLPEQPGR